MGEVAASSAQGADPTGEGASPKTILDPVILRFAVLDSVLASPPSPEDRERARKLVLKRFSIRRLAEDVERLYVEALKQAGVGVS